MEETALNNSGNPDAQVSNHMPTESPESPDVGANLLDVCPPVDDAPPPQPSPPPSIAVPSPPPISAEEAAAAVSSVVVVLEPISMPMENGVPQGRPKVVRNVKSSAVGLVVTPTKRSRRRGAMSRSPSVAAPVQAVAKRKLGALARGPRKAFRKEDASVEMSLDIARADNSMGDPELAPHDDDDTVSALDPLASTVNNLDESALPPPSDALINSSPTSDLTTTSPKLLKRARGKKSNQYKNLLKTLDRSLLYRVLMVGDNQYQCPICDCLKNHVGHMILHIRVHKDLTRVLELYKNAGGTIARSVSTGVAGPHGPQTDQAVKLKIPRMRLKGGSGVVASLRETVGKRLRVRTKKHDFGFFPGTVRQFNRKLKEDVPLLETLTGVHKLTTGSMGEPEVAPAIGDPSPPLKNSIIQVRKGTRRKRQVDQPPIAAVSDTDGSMPHSEETTCGSDGDWAPGHVAISSGSPVAKTKKLDRLTKRSVGKQPQLPLKQSTSSSSSIQNKAKQEEVGSGSKKAWLSRQIATLLKQDLVGGKVSADNPHICRFCGKVFYHATGLHFHYVKHTKQLAVGKARKTLSRQSSVVGNGGEPGSAKPFDRAEFAFDELVTALKREEQENEAGLLKELGDDVNVLLEQLVSDTKVLRCLGWPRRNTGDLLIDILERCELQPWRERLNIISPLQCLRKNVFELLTFCIKESAMQEYGWNQIDNVDEVVKEIIGGATELYQN